MKRSLIEKVSSAKSGRNESVWFVTKSVYETEPSVNIVSPIFSDKDDAEKFFKEYEVTPGFAEEITVWLDEFELDAEQLCYVKGFEDCDEEVMSEILKEIIYGNWEDVINHDDKDFNYEFKSLDGAVLVFWSWQTYIGYARKCIDIRDAFDETEEILVKKDHVFVPQADVIITAEEAKELSIEDRRRLLEQRLLEEGDWRWQNNAQKYIDEYMEKYEEES